MSSPTSFLLFSSHKSSLYRPPSSTFRLPSLIPLSLFLLFSSLFSLPSAQGQQQFLPLNREYNLAFERQLNSPSGFSHTGFKPYLQSKINSDSLAVADSLHLKRHAYKYWIGRKLKSESLVVVDSGDFHLTADPLIHFSYAMDFADTSLRADTSRFYTNMRGVILRANIGSKVSVVSSFIENQSFFPQYVDNYVKTYRVVPGSGRAKPFKGSGYDYAMASGYVSWSPSKNLNLQAGHDKNFVGDGYRSLLLSDNAFNYPFLKITSFFFNNRIQYTNLYARLSSLDRIPITTTPEALFKPKAGTFHYLSIIPWKYVHIGFFEGMIWQRWDSTGTQPFNWNMINPLIFTNTAVFGMNAKNNSLTGVYLKIKPMKQLMLYSQVISDDLRRNKYGYQFGVKYFDLFTVKNLLLQLEYNEVQPYAFSHEIPLQNYAHYNQALAHPYGADFKEYIAIVNYRWRDFFAEGKLNYAEQSDRSRSGRDIFSADIVNQHAKTASHVLFFQDYRLGYCINRVTNMNLFTGWINRRGASITANTISHSSTQLFYFGIRTSLNNQYFDF